MKFFNLFLIIGCFFNCSLVWASEICQPVDLRNSRTMPERSQLYQYEGINNESSLCWAFSIANLVGNAIGEAVSVEQFAINERENYYRTSPYTGDQSLITASSLWPMTGGHGTPKIETNLERAATSEFCSQREFDRYRNSLGFINENWYTSIARRAQNLSREEFVSEVNRACQNPLRHAQNIHPKFIRSNQYPDESNNFRQGAELLRSHIDGALNTGNPVLFEYEAHIVTIVGRDSQCNYLIQDSIPASIRSTRILPTGSGYPNYYHNTLSEHIQVWSEEAILNSLTYVGIGYFDEAETDSISGTLSRQ
jgi:hypothetical protein